MERLYDIKPKTTNYGEILYRSRIEAKWAVFFDSLGVEYEYEPYYEEVGTDHVTYNYLPDFYLPNQEIFLEIKPGIPVELEKRKAAFWCKDIQDIIILFNINPPTDKLENGWLFHFPNIKKIPIIMKYYWWGECPKCGHIDIAEYAYITSCGCFSPEYYNDLYIKEEISGKNLSKSLSRSIRLMKAYSVSKNYQFKLGNNERVQKLKYQSSLF